MKKSYSKKYKIMSLLLAMTFFLGVLFSSAASIAYSDSLEQATSTSTKQRDLTERFDPYVQVRDNRYVLVIPEKNNFTADEIFQVQTSIQSANQQVSANYLIINPSTKTAENKTLFAKALKSSGYTFTDFWWGTRYYFRTNAAVYAMDHDLDNYSIALGTAGALAGLASAGIASAIGVIGASYFQKMKSDLDYMNNIHPNDYLNMDVYFTGYYSIYVP